MQHSWSIGKYFNLHRSQCQLFIALFKFGEIVVPDGMDHISREWRDSWPKWDSDSIDWCLKETPKRPKRKRLKWNEKENGWKWGGRRWKNLFRDFNWARKNGWKCLDRFVKKLGFHKAALFILFLLFLTPFAVYLRVKFETQLKTKLLLFFFMVLVAF